MLQSLVPMMNSWPFGVDSKSPPISPCCTPNSPALTSSLALNWFNYKPCLRSRFSTTITMPGHVPRSVVVMDFAPASLSVHVI